MTSAPASAEACAARSILEFVHLEIPVTTYMGTSLIRNRAPLGPYSRIMPRDTWRPKFAHFEISVTPWKPLLPFSPEMNPGEYFFKNLGWSIYSTNLYNTLLYND